MTLVFTNLTNIITTFKKFNSGFAYLRISECLLNTAQKMREVLIYYIDYNLDNSQLTSAVSSTLSGTTTTSSSSSSATN